MAEINTEERSLEDEKKRINEDKKALKAEQKSQKKLARKRAKEIAAREADLADSEEGGGVSVFLVTVIIVVIWLAILALLIKMDVGGFGSGVLAPVLKNVPVVNKILPKDSVTETQDEVSYGGYSSLREAVDYIKLLEQELEQAQSSNQTDTEEITKLKEEVLRLKEFEDKQVEFQRIKNQFYEEVIYADNGPGPEEYVKYYESMDPATAEELYKQVVAEQQVSKEIQDYAQAYSEMKPKEAAQIFEAMPNNLELAAKILGQMTAQDRGKILGVMDPDVAAKITKIMDPEP